MGGDSVRGGGGGPPAGRGRTPESLEDRILRDVLEAIAGEEAEEGDREEGDREEEDREEEVDRTHRPGAVLQRLKARHRGHESLVEEIWRVAVGLEELARAERQRAGQGAIPASLPGSRHVLEDRPSPEPPPRPRHPPGARPRLRSGETIGDFTIEAFLGRGGMGEVYRARQRSLGDRPVALKVFALGDVGDPAGGRFRDEALAAASLHHPHLAEVYGFAVSGDVVFYAMRLVEGPSLVDVLRHLASRPELRGSRSWTRAIVRWGAEVASALAEAHQAGLVHRDVKPGNILIETGSRPAEGIPRGPAVLVDFGLAGFVRGPRGARREPSSATRAYAAPEQVHGVPCDPRTDVFALGATLHDLFSGRLASDRLPASLGLELLSDLVPSADPDLVAIVGRAADPLPRWRYPAARALQDDLESWLAGGFVTARRPGSIEAAVRWTRLHPGRVLGWIARAAAVAAVAAALGAGLWSAWSVRQAARSVRIAASSGDVVGLFQALDGVPRVLERVVLPEDLRGLRGEAGDLHTVLVPAAQGDNEAALRLCAEILERDGLAAHPVLVRFLLRGMPQPRRGEGETEGFHSLHEEPAPGTEQPVDAAMILVARLFFESPLILPEEVRAATPLRRRLLDLVRHPGHAEQGLLALMALGGCATFPGILELVGSLEETLRRSPGDGESIRMHVCAIDAGLRHAFRRGELDGIPRLEWRLFTDRVRDALKVWLQRAVPPQRDVGRDWAEWIKGLAFVARRIDVPSGFESANLDFLVGMDRFRTRAALQGPEMSLMLLDDRERFFWEENPKAWGWCCEALGDPRVVDAACARLESMGGDSGEFERGAGFARAEKRGERPEREPDPLSRLDSRVPAALVRVPDRRGKGTSRSAVTARWSFRTPAIEREGLAGPVRKTVDASFYRDRDGTSHHWRMRRGGSSRMVLRFDLDESHANHNQLLDLSHVAASRPGVPHGGMVLLDLLLDGHVLCQSFRVDWKGEATGAPASRFLLRGDTLPAGPHTLEIRLRDATTTYWLFAVSLHDTKKGSQ